MTSLRKRVTIGALGVAVAAGGGIAYAATKSSDPRDAYLNDVAKRLDVTPEKLRAAMKGASLDQLDQAVKDGNLTQEQADQLKKDIEQGRPAGPVLGKPLFGGGGPGHDEHFGFGAKAFGAGLDAVAKYLGLSPAEVRKQLADCKSLADVAKAQGKDLDGLEKVITDEARTQLDQAVKDGKLTKAQADKMAAGIAAHVDDIVTLAPPRFGGGPRFKGGPGVLPGGPRFKGGPGPLPGGPRGFGGGHGRGFGFALGPLGPDVEAVAKDLGMSASELRKQLARGKSLADVAKAQGKDLDGLKKVIAERVRTRLDDAVKRGMLDKAQADAMVEKLTAHLDEMLNMSLPDGLRP